MSGERTEQPTQRRREDARRKGQGVGRSHELAMGVTLGVGLLVLSSLLPQATSDVSASMRAAIESLGEGPASTSRMVQSLGGGILLSVTLVLPLALAVAVSAVAANLVAGGLIFSVQSVRLDFSKINPVTGMKNLFSRQALTRLGLASAKLGILAFVTWQVLGERIPAIILVSSASTGEIGNTVLAAIFQLGLTITVLLTGVALIDYVTQRRRAQGQIRMTKQEVKQEYREQEGDPQIRGARRRRARQIAFARMMDAVQTADVVVTNPTHLAVALKYDSLTMRAPQIVAKGQRLMAERIKEVARKHGVQIVEDKPLARALFPRPLGSEVPPHLYRAVAQLLVIVQQARFGLRGRQPTPVRNPGMALRPVRPQLVRQTWSNPA
jgi:flagellar biosynthesis protein FlhB